MTLLTLAAVGWSNVPVGPQQLEDPTRPLRAPAPSGTPAVSPQGQPQATLESVLIGNGRRVAVINGRRMTEGDERLGVKVWEIRADAVVVSVNGAPPVTLTISNARMHKDMR